MELAAYLDGLDVDQRAVAAWRAADGNLKVEAAAGSGKTRSLIGLAARLIVAREVVPSRLAVVTFSDRGAKVLRSRLEELLPKAWMPTVGTFHSAGLRYLKAGDPNRWAMFRCADMDARTRGPDTPDGLMYWRAAVEYGRLPATNKPSLNIGKFAAEYMRIADLWRARGVDRPEDVPPRTKEAECPKKFREAWRLVVDAREAGHVWDFNDVLSEWYAAIVAGNDRIDGAMVDEAQDNSKIQLAIVQAWAPWIALVGDPFQQVHRWRGAYPELFDDAERVLNAKVLYLPNNYRSHPDIVLAGEAIITGSPIRKRTMQVHAVRSKAHDDTRVVSVVGGFIDDASEAEWVAEDIETAMANGAPAESFWILCRTNALVGTYQAALTMRGIPMVMTGNQSLFGMKEALTVLCYCMLSRLDAWNSLDKILNVPNRRLTRDAVIRNAKTLAVSSGGMIPALQRLGEADGRKALRDLAKLLKSFRDLPWHEVPDAVVAFLLEDKEARAKDDLATPEEDRPAIMKAAATVAKRFNDPMEFVSFADRMGEAPKMRGDDVPPVGKVLLGTIHRSKGGEAKVVYVPCSEGVLPHWRSCPSVEAVEDERNLAYVAVTRAEERVVLLWNRQVHGQKGGCYSGESRFLRQLRGEKLGKKKGAK